MNSNEVRLLILIATIGRILVMTTTKANMLLSKTDIIHTASGLIFHYVSEYRPSNKIITFMVAIPIVEDMCYLVPISSMKKIPRYKARNKLQNHASDKQNTGRKSTGLLQRIKRFVTDIISIGLGSAALAHSTVK